MKPSIVLFRPRYDAVNASTPIFPWALLFLAAPLVDQGYDVTIIDEAAEPQALDLLEQTVRDKKPLVVGISSMTGEQIRFGLRAAQRVRDVANSLHLHPAPAIVWGGIHPSLRPEQTACHALVDYVIAGEGEETLSALVRHLEHPDGETTTSPFHIPGVYYRQQDGRVIGNPNSAFVALDTLSPLPYHLVDVERYITHRPDLGIDRYFEVCTSRGCPHRCGFCYIESVHSRRWRTLPTEVAVRLIVDSVKRFRLDGILFREDNFFVNRERVQQIAEAFLRELPGVKWAASCRIDYFTRYDEAFIDLLEQSGCVLLTFGVESGSNETLAAIHKDITREQVLSVVRTLAARKIRGNYHFMSGFPGETRAQLAETLSLIDTIRRIDLRAQFRELAVFTPYPGTHLVEACIEGGYTEPNRLDDWEHLEWFKTERPWIAPSQHRYIVDAQFLIARINHAHPAIRLWARLRWWQLRRTCLFPPLVERQLLVILKRWLSG